MSDYAALDAITEAVESGAGLPEVVRAAARALDASLAVSDAWGATLAVAARSPAEERALLSQGEGVTSIPLRVADTVVGALHMRAKTEPSASMRRLLATMIASEVERVRAPERASETAAADFLRAVLARELTDREELLARAKDLSLDVQEGASMIVARAHPQVPTDEGWRGRVRAVAERGARAVASRSIAALSERDGVAGAEVLLLVPGGDESTAARAAEVILREMEAGLSGYMFALGRSRIAEDPADLPRAASEALLAANVAQGSSDGAALAFEQTGAYRLLLSAMSENPTELQRFYEETRRAAGRLRRAVRDRPRAHARGVPRGRRQRRRDRPTPVHAPPHDLLPPGARARAVRPRCQLQRRAREAQPRAEGDARARHLLGRRPRLGGGRRRRTRAAPLGTNVLDVGDLTFAAGRAQI